MLSMGTLLMLSFILMSRFFYSIYIKTYWNPEYLGILNLNNFFLMLGFNAKGSEDVFFFFFMGGISAVIYEEILGKRHFKKKNDNHLPYLLLFPIIILISIFLVKLIGSINIIYGDFIGFFICALIVYIFRRDLILHSLISALLTSTMFLTGYLFIILPLFPNIIHKWWILHNTSGIFLFGVPLEEFIWAFTLGLWVGPAYEFVMGIRDRKKTKKLIPFIY